MRVFPPAWSPLALAGLSRPPWGSERGLGPQGVQPLPMEGGSWDATLSHPWPNEGSQKMSIQDSRALCGGAGGHWAAGGHWPELWGPFSDPQLWRLGSATGSLSFAGRCLGSAWGLLPRWQRNVRVAVYMGCVGGGVRSWHRANTSDKQSSGPVLEGSAGNPGALWGWGWRWVQVLPLSLPLAETPKKRALLRREVLARNRP